MSTHRPPVVMQRLASWLALVAILLGAVLPARALPANTAWALGVDICSASQTGPREGPRKQPNAPASHAGDHCSACWLSQPVGLPPAMLAVLPAACTLAPVAAPPVDGAPRPQPAWIQAPSRAPPLAT